MKAIKLRLVAFQRANKLVQKNMLKFRSVKSSIDNNSNEVQNKQYQRVFLQENQLVNLIRANNLRRSLILTLSCHDSVERCNKCGEMKPLGDRLSKKSEIENGYTAHNSVQDEILHETGSGTDTISSAVASNVVVPEPEPAQYSSNNDANLMSKSETEANATENSSSNAINKTDHECRSNESITGTDTDIYSDDTTASDATKVPSNDTVLYGTSSHIDRQLCDAKLITETKEDIRNEQKVEDEVNEELVNLKSIGMGANDSKSVHDTRSDSADTEYCLVERASDEKIIEMKTIPSKTSPLILHRMVKEEAESEEKVKRNNNKGQDEPHQKQLQIPRKKKSPNLGKEVQQESARVIIHRVVLEEPNKIIKQEIKENYRVESPADINAKLDKRLDRKEVQIQEISDESSSEYNDNPPLISEVESETETLCESEDSARGVLSIQTLPLNATDDDEDGSEEEEREEEEEEEEEEEFKSSSSEENNNVAKQRRVQKRVALETHFLPQLLSPRYLDSIIEENSDMSDARSDCSDNPLMRCTKTSDELIECSAQSESDTKTTTTTRANAIFPKSNLDFSKRHKHGALPKVSAVHGVIREEPVAMVVETKLVEQMPVEESCSKLSSMLTPESEAAEVVYIDSASSSISDLMELDIEESIDNYSQQARGIVNLDTDVREIITKPLNVMSTSRENTPVNETLKTSAETSSSFEVEMLKFKNNNINANATAAKNSQSMHSIDTNQLSQFSNILSSGSSEIVKTTHTISNSEIEKRSQNLQSFDMHCSDTKNSTPSSDSNSLRAKHIVEPYALLEEENLKMNNVREIVKQNITNATTADASLCANYLRRDNYLISEPPLAVSDQSSPRDSTPPPPIPPSSYRNQPPPPPPQSNTYAIEPHDNLKSSELTERLYMQTTVTLDSPSINNSLYRQESTDSHCSDSTNCSQCTAINTRDFDVTSSISDNATWKTANIGNFTDSTVDSSNNDHNEDTNDATIKKLRLLCTETLASMPYGEQVLEELATVAQNIGEVRATKIVHNNEAATIMPYPIPDLPHISDLQLSIDNSHSQPTGSIHTITIKQLSSTQSNEKKLCSPSPPPVPEPPSKYDVPWLGLPTDSNPNLFICLSPSQRSYINDKPQQISGDNNPDQLLDAHQKFIERRGYHEYDSDQVKTMNAEKIEEQQILKTAAIMKKLRKSLTPPPPIPPPPVPSKSSQTAAKARSHTKRASDNDVSVRNVNEQQITAIPAATTKTVATAEASLANGEEENGHRLLAIIHDTNEYKQNNTPPKTSSFENNSRQQQEQPHQPLSHSAAMQKWTDQPKLAEIPKEGIIKILKSGEVSECPEKENMQSVESEMRKMFPTMGTANIFDTSQKRFSNIETSSNTPYCSQILTTHPKRYSNIETHSYESKKRVENGQVLYDYSNSKHESQSNGDKSSSSTIAHQSNGKAPQQYPSNESEIKKFIAKNENEVTKTKAKQPSKADEIMSALKLNTNDSKTTTTTAAEDAVAIETKSTHSERQQLNDNTNAKLSETTEETTWREYIKNRQQNEEIKDINSAYEEFRQRAKAAAEAPASALPPATAPATFSEDKLSKSSFHFDHEKLFKDFDDLSQQLHKELETGKQQREQREKSASLYDLSRVQMQFRDQFANLKKERHEHMKELEHEIERSMRSRQLKSFARQETILNEQQRQQQQQSHTYEIPIRIENGSTDTYSHTDRTDKGVYNNLNESAYTVKTPVTLPNYEYDENAHCRRAESMFNLSENTSSQSYRPRTSSTSKPSVINPDDWSRYASDLGSSDNITKPFAREVEICYQHQRPRIIRAPRLSASTNDLSVNAPTYDSYNAYNVRRTHAPMLNQAPQYSRPQYLSCHSMIERDPNPIYISTTSRRGVSPAPASVSGGAPPLPPPVSPLHYASQEIYDRELNKRRASLPREIHEQQLKYISSKEEDLKNEIERLQNERRRLMKEMNQLQIPVLQPQMSHMRSMRDVYKPTLKLPTLSEDEVFRQQMAEEWLNKVAEREERRLQKIIKISKANEHEACQIPIHHTTSIKQDIGEEFLNRVKERRSKLAMPADSDWESGAESQPVLQGEHVSETEEIPKIKVMEGKSEADLRQLPRHLREFAKFSNHQCENIEGGQREVHQEEESRHEATNNCINSAIKKSSILKTVKISRPSEDQQQQLSVVNQNLFNANSAGTTGQSGQAFADTDIDPLSTTTPMTFNPPPPIPKSPFLTKLPATTCGEMFSTSPFKSRIFEEFDNFWRSFENNNNNNTS